jgi:hypothetical protein
VGVSVKDFIKLCNKLGLRKISMEFIFMPLPPLPMFKILIENIITNFFQLTSNAMQRQIILYLGDPNHGIIAIKFIDLNSGNTWVMMKGVGMKGHSLGGIKTIYFGGLFNGGRGSWD